MNYLQDGLEFVALLLMLIASARCAPSFFGLPLGLAAGAILNADIDLTIADGMWRKYYKEDHDTIETKLSTR